MAGRIYKNNKTSTNVMTGEVKKVSDDRMSFVLKTQEYDKANKTNVDKEILIRSNTPIEEDVVIGQNITCVGYIIPDPTNPEGTTAQAMYISNKDQSWDYKTLSVVNGAVSFARYVDEKNEDGTPKMTKEFMDKDGNMVPPHAKAPHFDIGIQTKEDDEQGGTKRVLHTIRLYAYKGDTKQIDRMKTLFKNFDKENNPCYATVVTQPGQETSQIREYNGKEYTNFYCQHMGISSIDVVFTKDREQKKEAVVEAPKQETSAPAPSVGVPTGSPVETDIDEEMFL